jgi:glucose-6-phosphate isomerase
VNANTVAQLLYLLEVETAMAGRLYNVNTFDQPGVEEGKQIARKLMGGGG